VLVRSAWERPPHGLAQAPVPCHTSLVRLSRPRVLLRAALLLVGAAFMFWRAWEARAAARTGAGAPQALLLERVALIEGLVGVLALAAAAAALLALRRRPRTHTLRLRLEDPERRPR